MKSLVRCLTGLSLVCLLMLLCVGRLNAVSSARKTVDRPGRIKASKNVQQADVPVDLGNGMKLVMKTIKEENKKFRYNIEASYPQIEGSKDARVAGFNRQARLVISRLVNQFRTNVRDPRARAGGVESESYIEAGFSPAVANANLVSIEYGTTDYYAGAAHPNHRYQSLNYDLKAGRALRLAELFKPGSNYLRTISNYCIGDLKKQISQDMADDKWIREGAAPKLSNFKAWSISREGLHITFDPYQVAPYAAGPQEVTIPYSALKGIIAPRGALASLAK